MAHTWRIRDIAIARQQVPFKHRRHLTSHICIIIIVLNFSSRTNQLNVQLKILFTSNFQSSVYLFKLQLKTGEKMEKKQRKKCELFFSCFAYLSVYLLCLTGLDSPLIILHK